MKDLIHPPTLLIAMPSLMDPNFRRAVILLLEHNDDGAMGFIVNRLSGTPVNQILARQEEDAIPGDVQAWIGGPIDSETGLILRPDGNLKDSNISLTSSEDSLQEMINYAKDPTQEQVSPWLYPYRFIIGYAGWGPKQLDQELRLGAWIETPCDNNLLFNCKWQSIWEESLIRFGAHPHTIVSQSQPYLN